MGPDSPLGIGIGWFFGFLFIVMTILFVYSMGKIFHENKFKDYVDKSQVDKPSNKLMSAVIFTLVIVAILFLLVEPMK